MMNRKVGFLLVMTSLWSVGCQELGWVIQSVFDNEQKVMVKAAYPGLQDRKVAVLVSADDVVAMRYPQAPDEIGRGVSRAVTAELPGTHLLTPDQIDTFTDTHKSWVSMPRSDVAKQLDVQRVVTIDLHEYRTREAGNAHIWLGVVKATIDVYEADGSEPDASIYRSIIEIVHPENQSVGAGVLNSDDRTIELGMVKQFSTMAAHLFADHVEIRN